MTKQKYLEVRLIEYGEKPEDTMVVSKRYLYESVETSRHQDMVLTEIYKELKSEWKKETGE